MLIKIFLIYLAIVSINAAVKWPSAITKCKKSDSDCMEKSIVDTLEFIKNGYREWGFQRIEPFYIEKLELIADPSKSVRLDQTYEHIYMHGMLNPVVKNFKLTDDGKNCKWEMEIHSPQTRMEADYVLSGQLLVFPINGNGKCNVTLTGMTNVHTAKCEKYESKGKSYLRLKDYKLNMNVEKCYFDFENIIPGNEKISQEVGKTINENSLEIFKDVKGGFEQLWARLHENAANQVFSKIPEDELFLPE
ncbi:hypothetical protein ABEB36_007274 [Hypothenemus hampei]|uniref:Uncharacterized protein n=1 Tax=Hypothenemus hampei TaxID=57062 RepID=A0ABD1ETL6_HYPHA